jgi:hypothetical protein
MKKQRSEVAVPIQSSADVLGEEPVGADATTLVSSPTLDTMVAAVVAFASGDPTTHTVVAGGFGAGKSYALGRASEVASQRGLRVASLERGPLGISSYADFLVAVAKATKPSRRTRAEVDGWRRALVDEGSELDLDELERRVLGGTGQARLVVVVESLDQLLHQVRSLDRPRLANLLTRKPTTLLILASVHGMGLAAELGVHVRFVQATYLPDLAEGTAFALQEARRLGAETSDVSERFVRKSSALDPAVRSNWLFWSLVGRYIVVARGDPLRWAEEDLRARAASHFDAMLLTLAPSEQRILLALAEAGGSRTVGDLADTIGVRNQAAATALGRLKKDDWVTEDVEMETGTDGRRTWYRIADPMLRIHLSL